MLVKSQYITSHYIILILNAKGALTDSFVCVLLKIVDADALWMWSRETLIPGLYSQEWYNGKKAEKGFLANFEDYLVGVPRVRLLRVQEG